MAKAAIDRVFQYGQKINNKEFQKFRKYFNQFEYVILPLSNFPAAAAQGCIALEYSAKNKKLDKTDIDFDTCNYDNNTLKCKKKKLPISESNECVYEYKCSKNVDFCKTVQEDSAKVCAGKACISCPKDDILDIPILETISLQDVTLDNVVKSNEEKAKAKDTKETKSTLTFGK